VMGLFKIADAIDDFGDIDELVRHTITYL